MDKDALQLSVVFSDVARKAAIKAANAHSDAALAAAIAALPKALVYKGAVNYYADLPTEGVEVGHCYTVLYHGTSGTKKDGTEYAWGAYDGGYAWIPYGPDMEEIFAHIADGTIHVTAADKAAWNGKIDKTMTATATGLDAGTPPTVHYDSSTNVMAFGIPKGDKGDKGDKGNTGATGPQGAAGKSAYASAQDGGYTGTEGQFNADLAGVGSKIGDAPSDGKQYARKNGTWVEDGGTVGVVASAYNANETYNKGDLVIYSTLLYAAKQDISTPEAWTADHWEQTTMGAEMEQYVKYATISVTCLTQDSVLVTGQTVTIRKGADASGLVYATAPYEGQPVSFAVPIGFDYFVSVSDTLAHHFNPTVAHGVVNTSTINVTLTYSDFSNIRTFGDVKAALNADIDLTGLVGEQVTATRQNKSLAFDVVDYDDVGKSVWLLLHDTMPNQMVFEPTQALAWFENGLPAGAYCFTHSNKNYYFTLAKPIPENGQLRATTSTFSTFANQDTSTAIESGSVSETVIDGATSLGTTATGNLNHMDRVNYGSNNAGESGLFAWLNSDAEPSTNLPRINKLSRPYSSGSDGGFLRGFDPDSLACLDEVTWQIQANNVYEAPASLGGITAKGQQYTITGKIGLAKFANVGLSGSNPWDLYVGATNTDRIKYYNGGARGWWVFDAHTNSANLEYYVSSSGGSGYNYAGNSHGVVPACKISKSA